MNWVDRFFRVSDRGSSLRTEVLGGLTTFATMAYIIVVNPAILSTILPVGPSTIATILVPIFGTLLMGVYANRPIAVATYMGENAFLALGLASRGIGWELRLGAVFVAGIFFLAITLLGIRSWLADSISPSLKHSFAAGIGVFRLEFLPILLTLYLMSFLDTLGTLVGVGAAGNMLDKEGNLPEMQKPMVVDAVACSFAAVMGSSTSGAYIESAAGVREGARTGLASVVTAILFAGCLFVIPLVQPLQHLKYAYGPARVAVGVLMFSSVRHIEWEDPVESAAAFATILMIALSFNIATGLTAGLIVHPLLKGLTGRWRQIRPGALVLAAICLVYYRFGLPH
jgi:xanthine/uracil/vitamin C permease (AzgA family)